MYILYARHWDQEYIGRDMLGIIENDEQLFAVERFLNKVFEEKPEEFTILDTTFYLSKEDDKISYWSGGFQVFSREDFFKSKARTAKSCSVFLSEDKI
jgi:hypothetical protein